MSSPGFNLAILARLYPGAGSGQVFPFDDDGTVTAAMDGGTITNIGVADYILLDLDDAVQSIAVIQTDPYPIGFVPASGTTINGYPDPYFVHSGEVAVFTKTENGNFDVTVGKSANNAAPVHNVREIGAMGDGTHPTEDTDSSEIAYGRSDTRAATIVYPETTGGSPAGYRLTTNVWGSLGTIADSMPGSVTDLGAALLLSAQQVLPNAARIDGKTSNLNNSTEGSMLRAHSDFPDDGTALLRIGRAVGTHSYAGSTDEACDGSTVEWTTINGAPYGVTNGHRNNRVGVLTSSAQERSGQRNCIVMNLDVGVLGIEGTGINPANCTWQDTDVWVTRRFGFDFYGKKYKLDKCTATRSAQVRAVTAAADNGSGLIRLTSAAHGWSTGQAVYAEAVGGVSNATGQWTITVIDANTFDLQGSTWGGAYTSGGVVRPVTVVTGAVDNGSGLVRLTATGHPFVTGDMARIGDVGGVTAAAGIWMVTRVDANTIDLQKSTFAGTFTSGGWAMIAEVGFRLRGSEFSSRHCHAEYKDVGLVLGGSSFWDFQVKVENFHAFNPTTYQAMRALVLILDTGSHLHSIALEHISTNTSTNGTYLIEDRVNGIYIPFSATNVRRYEIAGDYNIDSATTVKRPVFTSYYDWLCPTNRAVKGVTVSGTTDVSRTFSRSGSPKGRAGIVQVTSVAGSTPVFRTLDAPAAGDVAYVHFRQATTIQDAAGGGGTAAYRVLTSTGADIAAGADSYYRLTYGDARGAGTGSADAANYATRWYAEAV